MRHYDEAPAMPACSNSLSNASAHNCACLVESHQTNESHAQLQDLVTSFDAMVAALAALSDEAAAKFNQQASTAATLAASMSDTITAMREAAALNEALAEKYVEQTLMLDAATGQAVDGWSCDRQKYWELRFGVNRYNLQLRHVIFGVITRVGLLRCGGMHSLGLALWKCNRHGHAQSSLTYYR
jgi:hypothetical protein